MSLNITSITNAAWWVKVMATITIDGQTVEVEPGTMVIEAADDAGIVIPRFCYHKKLSVAANCRMCLIEVEKGRKPMPACATPVTDGMTVFTKSKMALDAQKAVMEFLLINHPLDCPICDQGGECELQDVSVGYGAGISQYDDEKRVVVDDDLGSLISTEMTRCIHCTRCVRFGQEVAGQREMGATGRGEHTQIGTFVKHSMSSEVSGNIIDLCPVGALTSKPYRYTARAWELSSHKQIAGHDCLGSNTTVHRRRNEVMRVSPSENESINETWLSDRDRFSYTGVNSDDRLLKPMLKKDGVWFEVEWQQALNAVLAGFNRTIGKNGADSVAAICSPSSTTEEAYLLQKLMRGIGVDNIDHRLHQTDFSDQQHLPMAPITSHAISEIENDDAIFMIGSDVQREQPLLGLRVRKATLNDAKVFCLNVVDYDFNFSTEQTITVSPNEMAHKLTMIVAHLAKLDGNVFDDAKLLLIGIESSTEAKVIAQALYNGKSTTIILGAISHNHPQAAVLRSLVHLIERYIDVKVYRMTEGANEAGCHIAGALPHRGPGGVATNNDALDLQASLANRAAGLFLLNVEPELDVANPHQARQTLFGAEFVTVVNSYKSASMLEYADVLLPAGVSFETSGTFVNACGDWQSFKGVAPCPGDARPVWKILRVLGNLFNVSGFDFDSSEDVLNELKSLCNISNQVKATWFKPEVLEHDDSLVRIGQWPLYRADSMTRHATPLQKSAANDLPCVKLNSQTAKKYKLQETATVSQGDIEITLPLIIDDRVSVNAVYIANAWPETSDLGLSFGTISLK